MRLKIGNFNLFNLVLPNVRYHGHRKYSQQDYDKKCDWIAQQLDKMRCSIVAFEEVFHHSALVEAVERSQYLRGAEIRTANPDGDQPAVGLASLFPITHTEVIRAFPSTLFVEGTEVPFHNFNRAILRVEILVDTIPMTVFVTHLKSKRPIIHEGEDPHDPVQRAKGKARSLLIRAVESVALREILVERLRGSASSPVVVLGDMNDSALAVTNDIISGTPPHRRFDTRVKQKIWDVLLYPVKDIQARQSTQDVYYTYIHNGYYGALDHILVSQELHPRNPHRLGAVEYVKTYTDHLIDQTLSMDKVPVWKSDHGQVVASVKLYTPE
ncbi:endonuclease/exonuclease/phosphatase family protein [Persicobacter sp. CCB-QB2]|uniref:endonuclease/exonuclease/phosphatase family protein n=1 Tax=Persicobacter sp. CCB-QB2 TaxID=1561025 RepID=UPI0006A9A645|nr:endonuclease/exonuclease/phosphatase family protein [Persicobacter sp. CCB-QB2]